MPLEKVLREVFEKIENYLQKTPKTDSSQRSIENWLFWLRYPNLIKTSEYQTLFGLIFKKAYDKKLKTLNLPRIVDIAITVALDFFQDALDFSELNEEDVQVLFNEIKVFMKI